MRAYLFISSFLLFFCCDLQADPYESSKTQNLYIGVRGGYSHNENSCMNTSIRCDKNQTAYGLFTGYDFTPNLGLELSFNDIGDTTAEYPNNIMKGELHEWDIALKLSHHLYKQASFYGKFGAAFWDGDVTGGTTSLSGSGTRPLIGAGIEWPLTKRWDARLEYQYIDQVGNNEMGFSDPHFIGLALIWNFSTPHKTITKASEPSLVVTPPPQKPTPQPTEQRIVIDEQFGGPLFEFDKAEIRNTAAIYPIAEMLLKNPWLKVDIIGHTDSRGATQYNQNLSEARANTVAAYLHSQGVASNRINAYGMGEANPIADNQTDDGRAKNRRVEFIVSGTSVQP